MFINMQIIIKLKMEKLKKTFKKRISLAAGPFFGQK